MEMIEFAQQQGNKIVIFYFAYLAPEKEFLCHFNVVILVLKTEYCKNYFCA